MEILQLLAISAGIFVLILLCIVAYVHTSNHPKLPGPSISEYLPGGNVFSLFSDSRKFNRILSSLSQTYGDVFQLWLGPTHVVVSSVPADVVQILSSTETFVKPHNLEYVLKTMAPGGLFTMQSQKHRATRKKLREHFNHNMLTSFHTHMVQAVDGLCSELESAAEKQHIDPENNMIDITQFLAATTFRIITNVAFGTGMSNTEILQFGDTMNRLLDELMLDVIGYPIRQLLTPFGVRRGLFACRSELGKVCREFIEKRISETKAQREARHTDVLDTILQLCEGDMTKATSMAIEFATAGSHTSNEMLAWCIYDICQHPQVQAKIDKELSDRFGDRPFSEPVTLEDMKSLPYIGKVWKETCRRRPILVLVLRRTTKEIRLKGSGIVIPKGKHVFAHMYRAQTNPKTWNEPLVFNPDRWGSGEEKREGDRVVPGAYIPFGIGVKSCAGRFLADYSAPLILTELQRRFKFGLACRPEEVVSSSRFVETPKFAPVGGEEGHVGVPVIVEMRRSP